MIRSILATTALLCATSAAAQDMRIDGAYIPLAPPGAMSHAAYLTLANTGKDTRSLIGITAEGYGMAHLHQSKEHDGVATMSMVHQMDIAPGQSVSLRPGSFHVMLMHPLGKRAAGDSVTLTLQFANGEELVTKALIQPRDSGT